MVPRDFVRSLLEPQLQYAEDERDVAVIRVDVRGIQRGRRRRLLYQVIALRDLTSGLLAMNRTVGYTASIGAQMILRGDIRKRGLLSPLTDIPTDVFFQELRERGISVQREEGDW
jgi:saccharopine dehydrogenase-like NADP-dependent oxidoreductase